jgi:hypothetical protein
MQPLARQVCAGTTKASPALFDQLEKSLKGEGEELVKRVKVRLQRTGISAITHRPSALPLARRRWWCSKSKTLTTGRSTCARARAPASKRGPAAMKSRVRAGWVHAAIRRQRRRRSSQQFPPLIRTPQT